MALTQTEKNRLQFAVDLMLKTSALELPFDSGIMEMVSRVAVTSGFFRSDSSFMESARYNPISTLLRFSLYLGSIIDPDAASFFSRAGLVDTAQRDAINYLATAAKSHGWWDKTDVIYPFVGGTAAAHALNLKSSLHPITWSGGITHNANGVAGDGLTGYGLMDFNLNAAMQFTQNSAHLFAYAGSYPVKHLSTLIGGSQFVGATRRAGLLRVTSFPGSDYICLSGLNQNIFEQHLNLNGDFLGPVIGSRVDSMTQYLGRREVFSLAEGASAATTGVGNQPLAILARRYEGPTYDSFSDANLRGVTIGAGLSQSEWNVFRADWDTFNFILNRRPY